jgi:glycine betaine/proline transport system substrate-binding protein
MGPRRRRFGVRIAALALLATAVSGCGGAAPALMPAPGVQPEPCGTVTLASNAWAGYDANLAVVSYLARTKLGCTVMVKAEAEADSWKHLADGSVDAILENWGHDDLKKKYIDTEQVAVEGGLTGNKGIIGWYVPPWMAEAYPDITNWKNLNKYAHLFTTPKSGAKGQFLDGDPTYVTFDEALLRNLGLNYTVVYSGSEAKLIQAFQKAERNRTPLIGYFYSPQWLLAHIDLVHIDLPPYTPGCDADPETVRCDYQPYDLDKILSRSFAYSGSPAAELIQKFQWTNEDQNQVASDITAKMPPDKAAKKWLDAHPAAWRSWMPAST